MGDIPASDAGDEAPSELPDPLRTWERICAGLIGVVLCGFGVWAVFASENQAGSAILLLVAAAFLFLAIQGTALTRLGGDSAGIELERRRRIEGIRRVLEEARAEENPDVARGLAEAATIIEPDLPPRLRAIRNAQVYELLVQAALVRVGADVTRTQEDFGVDLIASVRDRSGEERIVQIVVKYLTTGAFYRRSIPGWVTGRRMVGVLVVTNAELSSDVQRINEDSSKTYGSVEVVSFSGSKDDGVLRQALLRVGHVTTAGE